MSCNQHMNIQFIYALTEFAEYHKNRIQPFCWEWRSIWNDFRFEVLIIRNFCFLIFLFANKRLCDGYVAGGINSGICCIGIEEDLGSVSEGPGYDYCNSIDLEYRENPLNISSCWSSNLGRPNACTYAQYCYVCTHNYLWFEFSFDDV